MATRTSLMYTGRAGLSFSRYALCLVCGLGAGHAALADGLIFGAGPDTSGGTDPDYPGASLEIYDSLRHILLSRIGSPLIYEGGFSFAGGIRVASGDVNGDGTPDIIAAPGAGSLGVGLPGPQVHAYDGITHNLISSFHPYGPGYTGGVTVASGGDFNGDGIHDIVNGTDLFGSPQFRVFSGINGDLLGTFSNLTHLGFAGGVNVDVVDFNDDGIADIVSSSGGTVALLETGVNGGGNPVWDTFTLPTIAPFGEAFTGEINTAILNIATTPGGADRPVLFATSTAGFAVVDISDPDLPTDVANDFGFGDLTNADVATGDFDGDGQDDIAVGGGSGVTWFTLDSDGPNSLTAAAQQTVNPFGGTARGETITRRENAAAFSEAFLTTLELVSGGLDNLDPEVAARIRLFGTMDIEIHATDDAAVDVDFNVQAVNLDTDDFEPPPGYLSLPNTRGVFVETDAPDGSYEAQIDFLFEPGRLEAVLFEAAATIADVRLAHILKNPDGSFNLEVIGDAAEERAFNDTVGDFTFFDGFEAGDLSAFTVGVDQFSGYALVVIPEPGSLAMLGLGGLALLRRRR